jgi:uncharacterized YigZ family protein
MLFEDTYLTIQKPAEGFYKDKGSKFLSFAFPVKTETEVKDILARLKKEHHIANHHCYAFRLGADKQSFRSSDDGEPSNTAGKPILGQIQSKDLTNILILIVVARYFGGTLLGVSGLINAYRQAAADVLLNAEIIEEIVKENYFLQFDYLRMNEVMKTIKDEKLEIISQHFEQECELSFAVRKNKSDHVSALFKKMEGVKLKSIN